MAEKMLSILHTESSCGWGGQEIRILTESRGMLNRGHRVLILCCPQSSIYNEAKGYGVPVIALPIEKKTLFSLLALRRWLKAEAHHFDVINTHSSTDAWLTAIASTTLLQMPAMIRTRHISTPVHDSFMTNWLYLKASSHIVTAGERLRQQLHIKNKFPISHMTSVATGIDLVRYQPGDKESARKKLSIANKPTIGIVATLRSWKGHSYLFECWQAISVAHPEWQLLVVGDGPQRTALQKYVTDTGISERIIFTGNRNDIPDCLNCMDIFVLPSHGHEGVPQSIMQAMACSLPVISTSVGAITEAVIHQKTGFIIEPKNNLQLREKLELLMVDNKLRIRMGEASLLRARSVFGIENMLNKMDTIFRKSAFKNY